MQTQILGPVIDTHCHLDLIEERGLGRQEALEKAEKRGVEALVQIATDLESSQKNQKLAQEKHKTKAPRIYWTAGLHPNHAAESKTQSLLFEELEKIFNLLQENRDDPNFIGIGETGLDYFHTNETEDIEKQRKSFASHLTWAQELKLPIILHTRDDRSYNPDKTKALKDCFAMVKESGVKGVLHCFSYTHKEAFPFIDLGWFVSYSGVLTFPNAKEVQEGMCKLPLDCLLVETDAPFLAPVPHRGKLNEPAYVQDTLAFLVQLRVQKCQEKAEHIQQSILSNAKRFLHWKEDLYKRGK